MRGRKNDTLGVWLGLALAAIVLAFLLSLAITSSAGAAPRCHLSGIPPFTAPDNRCTPGAFVHKTRADVCDGRTTRPNLRAAEERAILANYGFVRFTGIDGEKDHRVPLALGGVTDRRNIWPEAEVDGRNPKDRLEAIIFRRVCKGAPHAMRVRTAVHIFQADWRAGYTYYVLGIGPRPEA